MVHARFFAVERRIFVVAAISVTSLVVSGLLLYRVYAQSDALTFDAGSATPSSVVMLSPSVHMDSAPTVSSAPQVHEMHIASNGLVLLRSATVISVSGGTIRVLLPFDAGNFTWLIQTSSGTKYPTADGGRGVLEDIRAGDIVTATGMLTDGGGAPAIDAAFVRK